MSTKIAEIRRRKLRMEIMTLMNDGPALHRAGKRAMGTSLANMSHIERDMKKNDGPERKTVKSKRVAAKKKQSREKGMEMS